MLRQREEEHGKSAQHYAERQYERQLGRLEFFTGGFQFYPII
jgi:hypothetical protein